MLDYESLRQSCPKDQKINYDRVLQSLIKDWEKEKLRPKILLHSCCAPCSTYTLEYLTQYADVTVYYDNPNIQPRQEYERRKIVQQQFIQDFNAKTGQSVSFVAAKYEPGKWIEAVKDLKAEPEGGKRCRVCYDYRLDQVAHRAQDWGFDFFASALTISPHKNAEIINSVGFEVQNIYKVAYLPSDFKKRSGYRRSVEMSEEYNIYRQCYCGCLFAASQQGVDLKQISREASQFVQAHAHENFKNIAFHYHEH